MGFHFVTAQSSKNSLLISPQTTDLAPAALHVPQAPRLDGFAQLTLLNLHDRRIRRLSPNVLGNLVNLKVLVLSFNRFSVLADVAGRNPETNKPTTVASLERLEMGWNQFRGRIKLNQVFPGLEYADVRGNELTSVDLAMWLCCRSKLVTRVCGNADSYSWRQSEMHVSSREGGTTNKCQG